MSTTEAILEKVSALPPDKQEQVLEFVDALAKAPNLEAGGEPVSGLRSFANLKLEGSPDSSQRFHEHLYGENARKH